MTKPDATVRRPRHNVVAVDQIAAWIIVSNKDHRSHTSATLVDLSRNGCRLASACELKAGDTIRLVLDQPESERRTDILADVRWRQRTSGGTWEYGLEFTPELEWEFLGELFLSGALEDRATSLE